VEIAFCHGTTSRISRQSHSRRQRIQDSAWPRRLNRRSSLTAASELAGKTNGELVSKIQAWMTGRAGIGGVAFAKNPDDVRAHAARMLAMAASSMTNERKNSRSMSIFSSTSTASTGNCPTFFDSVVIQRGHVVRQLNEHATQRQRLRSARSGSRRTQRSKPNSMERGVLMLRGSHAIRPRKPVCRSQYATIPIARKNRLG
jgi:hypothetical protein